MTEAQILGTLQVLTSLETLQDFRQSCRHPWEAILEATICYLL
jgi:hypothetical protein